MKLRHYLNIKLLICCAMLTSCTTVKMPNLNILKSNAFTEDLKNIDTSIPDVDEAPDAPTDVRSTKAWDQSAKEMMAVRDGFVTPTSDGAPATAADIDAEFEAKKSKVRAYRLDDPVEE